MSGPARQLKGRAARLAQLMPAAGGPAARTPFVLLVVVLLGGGLITLLLLNSSLNEGSFRLSKLKKQTTDLTDEQQALQRAVDGFSAPGALERRARELGMVPGGSPAFLGPDGRVRGVPGEAETPPPEEPPVLYELPPLAPASSLRVTPTPVVSLPQPAGAPATPAGTTPMPGVPTPTTPGR